MFFTGALGVVQGSASAIRDPAASAADGQVQVERGWDNPRRSRVLLPFTAMADC